MINKTISSYILKFLKFCSFAFMIVIIFLFSFIFKDAYEQKYEPRGYVSPHNQDVSFYFSDICSTDFCTNISDIINIAKVIENVKGISFITIYFDTNNKIKSYNVTFKLENKGLFLGKMTINSNKTAYQEYVYYKYSQKYELSDYNNIKKQYMNLENKVANFDSSIQKAIIMNNKTLFYFNNELFKEYYYEK